MIINAREMGKKVNEICKLYFVKKTAVYELYKKYDEREKIEEPKKPSGRPPMIDAAGLSAIRTRLIEKNDITLQELIDELLTRRISRSFSVFDNSHKTPCIRI